MLWKVKNNHLRYLLLSLGSALLMILAWQPFKILPGVFLGLIPVLLLEDQIRRAGKHTRLFLFLYGWLTFLVWNVGTVWWIWNSSAGGALAAFFINSIPMVVPLLLYHELNLRSGKANPWYFAACWISLELLQFHWDFAFPWLILGNVFSYVPRAVQWYEFTGVLGGSVWVLAVNIKGFQLLQTTPEMEPQRRKSKLLNGIFLYLLAPLFLSWYTADRWSRLFRTEADVMVVQPNLDPYSEKFGGVSATEQLTRMMQLALAKADSQTQIILLPETALQGGLLENQLEQETLVQLSTVYLQQYPNLTLVSGMDSYRLYDADEKKSATARKMRNSEMYWDAYNAAVCLRKGDSIQVYHKNKLVPGVEKMPYPGMFRFLENYALDLGGTSGSLGSDGQSKIFQTVHRLKLAPIICYESVFSDFTASYVRKGADLLCILTNDGWWGNTPGYRQHFDYGRLRAVENRRCIARCANTGISGFIDADGTILEESEWWKETVLRRKIPVYTTSTFYTTYGDWIAWIFLASAALTTFNLFLRRNSQ